MTLSKNKSNHWYKVIFCIFSSLWHPLYTYLCQHHKPISAFLSTKVSSYIYREIYLLNWNNTRYWWLRSNSCLRLEMMIHFDYQHGQRKFISSLFTSVTNLRVTNKILTADYHLSRRVIHQTRWSTFSSLFFIRRFEINDLAFIIVVS